MARTRPEWIGKTDDDPVPPRVRVRVLMRFACICQICTTKIAVKKWVCDHRRAIINGGENRESNLWPIHVACDRTVKTPSDVAEKSENARVAMKHHGIRKAKGRPMPGTRASGIRKRMSGRVERW